MTSADLIHRRTFLRNATGLALGASAANAIFDLRLMQTALAQSGGIYPDYKALVCVFLNGGNDGNNVVIPFDTGATGLYNNYFTVRKEGLALFREALPANATVVNGNTYYGLPLSTARTGGEEAAVHSAMPEMQTLFNQGKLAFVRNVGTLTEPLTRSEYRTGKKKKPPQLFSHNDQVMQWQTSLPDLISRTGWGGRLMDRVRLDFAQQNISPGQVSMSVSIAGTNTWEVGEVVNQFKISTSGASTFQGYSGASNASRRTLIDQLLRDPSQGGDATLNATRSNLGMLDFRNVNERSLLNGSALTSGLASLPTTVTNAINAAFAGNNTGLASQLKMIARIIAARNTMGMRRQIFFCSIGGFDTHGLQPAAHAGLLNEVSRGIKAFYDATAHADVNVADKVTTFTAADFGRTFKPNGQGTDHAWGSNHIVAGGAVQGGKLYGTFPNFVLGGANDTDSANGATGRWIPTTSVDEYSASLARWFGVEESALDVIFPNLRRFPNRNLGIMG